MKQQTLHVAETPLNSMHEAVADLKKSSYELPDGTKIELSGKEVLGFTESMFFQASASGEEDAEMADAGTPLIAKTVTSMVTESISTVDLDIRKEMYSNVLVTGGNARIKGFVERLSKDLPDVAPQNLKVKVVQADKASNSYSSFTGASILASLGSFQ